MSNANFADFDSIMDASMDEIDDLPPVGPPPTGHYNLKVTAERKMADDESGREYVAFNYEVLAVNEVKLEIERSQVKEGQKFTAFFSPLKKDGTPNEFGIGFLKETVAPFSAHFGTPKMGETLTQIKEVVVAATLVRRPDRKDKERFNFNLSDVVIL